MLFKSFFHQLFALSFLVPMAITTTQAMEILKPTPVYPKEHQKRQPKPGHAILLLGTSSAGKSYICKEMMRYLDKLKDINAESLVMDDAEDMGISASTRAQFPAAWSSEHITRIQVRSATLDGIRKK